MTRDFTRDLFASTYKDDFADSDNYHRILFNNGRALQARELTQMQTITQREISRMGRNIFKEGAAVNPGGATCNNGYEFIKLQGELPTNSIVGTQFTSTSNSIIAEVIETVARVSESEPATIYVRYVSTSGGTSGSSPVRVSAGDTLSGGGETLTVQATNTVANPCVGQGTRVSIHAGDFFANDRFVFAAEQSLIISKYTSDANAVVGFKVVQDIVTVSDTAALYDNSGATPNLSAPGADRYRIRLIIADQANIAADENFIYICKVTEGVIVAQVEPTDNYNTIEDRMALRTSEESGNYIAKRFTVSFDTNEDDVTKLDFDITPGVAYVDGYRAVINSPLSIPVPKPRTTLTSNNNVVAAAYGQYVICSGNKGLPNIETFDEVNLYPNTTGTGTIIGTARVRSVEEDGANFRVYLFDIKINANKNKNNVKSLGNGSTDYMTLILENSLASYKDEAATSLLFPLPEDRPKVITDITLTTQRKRSAVVSGQSGSLTLTATGETFADTSAWIAAHADSDVNTNITFSGAGGTSSTIGGNIPDGTYEILTYVNKSAGTVRTKSITEVTETITPDASGNLNFTKADIRSIERITLADSDGADLTTSYDLDNGQRDFAYLNGRMVKKAGVTQSADVFVRYKHFTHGASGDFFAVNSYTGQVDYGDIPSYTQSNGTEVNLRNVLDFRSTVNSSGNFGSGARINEMPKNTSLISCDAEYYLGKKVRVVIDRESNVTAIEGEPSVNPMLPPIPTNALDMFHVTMNPFTINDADVTSTTIKAKRFTMRDIGKIEERIDKLEEATALSLLELETNSFNVLDASGNNRTKSGFFVDNFADRSFTDTENEEQRAAIDPSLGILSCQTDDNNIALVYDHSKSNNTILKGDNVYLNYTESVAISQTTISGFENVNPFAVITGEGSVTLSPASDEWVQTKYIPANVINRTAEEDLGTINQGRLRAGTARRRGFNQWRWTPFWRAPIFGFGIFRGFNLFGGWSGVSTWNSNGVRRTGTRRLGRRSQQTTFEQRVVVGTRTVRKVTGDRTVSLTFLPFMRSRKIMFRAEGMRPNTRYFPFFDGRDVSAYCREETFSRYASGSSLAYGNRYRNSSAHPQGSTDLESNSDGVIEGSFFLPSKTNFRFRGGTREFKLLDVSVNNDANALSRASANYISQGTLDTRQQTITSTRITQVRRRRWTEVTRRDPLAQTFRVTKPSGMFVTKVDVFFKAKDSKIPVEMQIRPVVNGQPSATDIISNAIKFLTPSEVSLAGSQTQAAAIAAPTTFEFDEPVFLNPNTEYAIVLLAESKDYEAYVAETYAFELGSTEKRVNRQPSLGSLFKSQNGSTWTPDQTKDLAFKIYQADFNTAGGYAVFENADVPDEILEDNPFFMQSGSNSVTLLFPNHGYSVTDTINISGLVDATTYNGVLGSNINGLRTVTAVDGFGLRFDAGSSATSSGRFGGSEIVVDQQLNFDVAIPNFLTILPDDTTLSYGVKFTTGSSLAGSETRYQKDPNYSGDIQIGDENLFSRPRLIAKAANESGVTQLDGERSVTFKVDLGTSRSDVSPMIDAQRTSLTTTTNLIDRQASSSATGFNVPLSYAPETDAVGGSSLSKHHTSVQTLEEDAVGLKVILSAVRPSGAELELYYRVANDGDSIFDVDWTLQPSETTIAPDENNFREYRYLIGGDGGDVNSFTQYQLKLVFTTSNQSKPPVVKDLRGIALAV